MDVDVDLTADPVGVGRAAEVFAIDEDRVVKLLRPEWPADVLDVEEAKARHAHAAGIASPAVLGRATVDGRVGIVFERVPATSMLDVAFADIGRALDLADDLADLQVSLFGHTAPDLPNIKDVIADHIDRTDLPTASRRAAKDALLGLPDGEATLHFDFHPANVLVGNDRMYAIDWANAGRGAAAADVARTLVLMTPVSATVVVDVDDEVAQLVTAFADRYRQRVLDRMTLTDADVAAWRLPIIAARLHELIEQEHDLLHAEIARLVG